MKKEIERLNQKYNINCWVQRCRYDAYDIRGGYFTIVRVVVNDTVISVTKSKIDKLEDFIKELEEKIIKALGK